MTDDQTRLVSMNNMHKDYYIKIHGAYKPAAYMGRERRFSCDTWIYEKVHVLYYYTGTVCLM